MSMKSLDEYTKEELYAELAAQSAKVECLTQEVERYYSIVMKLSENAGQTSSNKSDIRINV